MLWGVIFFLFLDMHIIKNLCFSVLLLTIGSANSQIITDRPSQSSGTFVINRGDVQIEAGASVNIFHHGHTSRTIEAPASLIRVGVIKGLELRMETALINHKLFLPDNTSEVYTGMSNLVLGTKFNLYNKENRRFKLSTLIGASLPTGTNLFTSELHSLDLAFLASHALSTRSELTFNLGINSLNGPYYTLLFSKMVNDKTSIFLEPYGQLTDAETPRIEHSVNAGLTHLLNDNLQLDFSFGLGITYNNNFYSMGLSWLINGNKQ